MTSTLPAGATGVITVDLAALVANWRALSCLVAPAECGAVVKADAYGLGAAQVVPALVEGGCRTFFVATSNEAAAVRGLARAADIYALDGLLSGNAETIATAGAMPVLSSLPEVKEWAAFGGARRGPHPCALQVDTGLNRLGLPASEARSLFADVDLMTALDVRMVMSHLACADDPADPKNEQQRRAFEVLRPLLPKGVKLSLAASDGLMLGKAYHYDLVRPGYALYGGQAFRGGATPVHPVVKVEACILQVRDVAPGESVGYSATWKAARPSRIAIVAAGYADGYFRAGSNPGLNSGAIVGIGSATAPVVGRVSMDLITVDVTDIVPAPQRGDLVTLVGPGLTIETMGHCAGTIGYEVLTSLSRRFFRRYIGSGGQS